MMTAADRQRERRCRRRVGAIRVAITVQPELVEHLVEHRWLKGWDAADKDAVAAAVVLRDV